MACEKYGLPYSPQFSAEALVIMNPPTEALRPFIPASLYTFKKTGGVEKIVVFISFPENATSGGLFAQYHEGSNNPSDEGFLKSLAMRDFRLCTPLYDESGLLKKSGLTREMCFKIATNHWAAPPSVPANAASFIDISEDGDSNALEKPPGNRKSSRLIEVEQKAAAALLVPKKDPPPPPAPSGPQALSELAAGRGAPPPPQQQIPPPQTPPPKKAPKKGKGTTDGQNKVGNNAANLANSASAAQNPFQNPSSVNQSPSTVRYYHLHNFFSIICS